MATYGPESSSDFDIDFSLTEFAELDRRRLFGAPALEMTEVEYWLELRARLEQHLGKAQPESAEGEWLSAERREFIRLPTHIRIQFAEPAETEPRIARDISQGGLFIATRRPLDVGSEVRLQIEKPDSVVEVRGMVAWVQTDPTPERLAGMGIRFGKLKLEQRRAITQLVQDAVFEE